MNIEELLGKADSNQNELSHYGVPNQKWGVRRYQNEDGTLTPEGRKHYGLNPKYANLSDDDMRKTLNTARAKSEYVGLMTEGSRKRSGNIKGLVSSGMNLARTGTGAISTVASDRQRRMETKLGTEDKELDNKLKDMKSAYDAEKKVYDSIKNDPAKAGEKAAFEKKWADEAKQVTAMNDRRNAISEEKAGYKDSAEAAKANAELTQKTVEAANKADLSGSLGSLATSRQYQAERQQALSNLEEIDPDDLQAMINRIKLEKEYDMLINPPQPTLGEKIKKGIDSVDHWLALGLTILQVKNAIEKKRSAEAKHSDLSDDELAHAGVKGMKKGVRRYQNPDGSLTAEGYRHYGIDPNWSPQKQETPEQKEKRVRKEIEANYRTKALKAKYETQAERARSKEVERQIKRENKLEIDRQKQLYKMQNQQTKRELDIQNEAKADNRKNIRKNVMKALIGSAAIGMLVAKGVHNMRMDTLMTKNAHEMDMLRENGRQTLKSLKIEGKNDRKLETIKGKNSKNFGEAISKSTGNMIVTGGTASQNNTVTNTDSHSVTTTNDNRVDNRVDNRTISGEAAKSTRASTGSRKKSTTGSSQNVNVTVDSDTGTGVSKPAKEPAKKETTKKEPAKKETTKKEPTKKDTTKKDTVNKNTPVKDVPKSTKSLGRRVVDSLLKAPEETRKDISESRRKK